MIVIIIIVIVIIITQYKIIVLVSEKCFFKQKLIRRGKKDYRLSNEKIAGGDDQQDRHEKHFIFTHLKGTM